MHYHVDVYQTVHFIGFVFVCAAGRPGTSSASSATSSSGNNNSLPSPLFANPRPRPSPSSSAPSKSSNDKEVDKNAQLLQYLVSEGYDFSAIQQLMSSKTGDQGERRECADQVFKNFQLKLCDFSSTVVCFSFYPSFFLPTYSRSRTGPSALRFCSDIVLL